MPNYAPLDAKEQLTFQLMNSMLDDFMKKNFSPPAGTVERWAFRLGLLGAAFGMLSGVFLPNRTGLLLTNIGLSVEVAGFGVSLVLMAFREWNNFRHSRRTYAQELDHDYVLYREYVAALRKFPEKEREARLRYVRDRRQVMTQRMGLFLGGLEKLGVLPLLVALYIQFKDWEWGDWNALTQINAVQGLLIWALFLCYAAGWHLISLRSRIDAYELLLAEANQEKPE